MTTDSAVMVFELRFSNRNRKPRFYSGTEPKPKPRFSGGYVMVLRKFQKWPNPTTNACNNSLVTIQARLPPAPFEVTV